MNHLAFSTLLIPKHVDLGIERKGDSQYIQKSVHEKEGNPRTNYSYMYKSSKVCPRALPAGQKDAASFHRA